MRCVYVVAVESEYSEVSKGDMTIDSHSTYSSVVEEDYFLFGENDNISTEFDEELSEIHDRYTLIDDHEFGNYTAFVKNLPNCFTPPQGFSEPSSDNIRAISRPSGADVPLRLPVRDFASLSYSSSSSFSSFQPINSCMTPCALLDEF
jgi:hypothetical protein